MSTPGKLHDVRPPCILVLNRCALYWRPALQALSGLAARRPSVLQPIPSNNPKRAMNRLRPILLVFMPFAAGYYLSYLFRVINAVVAQPLVNDLGLDASGLGFLSSVYFLT